MTNITKSVPYTKILDDAIIQYCRSHLLTQVEFAKKVGISEVSIYQWRKRGLIGLTSLRKLLRVGVINKI